MAVPPKSASERRRPTQQRARETREHILDTAARLFGERGIAETSTNRIAAEAGVSIGTVYRYFADRSVLVEELLARLLQSVENRFTQRMFDVSGRAPDEVFVELLEVITEELVSQAKLLRALVAGVQFYSSGLPEFEPRLRLLVKVMLIQLLGPGDDHRYDVMTFVVINTGFAAALRTAALEVDSDLRRDAIDLTGRMIGAWLASEGAPVPAGK